MRNVVFLSICCLLIMNTSLRAQEAAKDAAVAATGDLCEILEVASTVVGGDVVCPVFVPAELADAPKRPALVVLPNSLEAANGLIKKWGAGELPGENRAILIVPRIDPKLQKERAFAIFSEIMQLASDRYRIDPKRLAVWGLGAAGRNAYFAARSLPDKFAAMVRPSEEIYLNQGYLHFAVLGAQQKIESIRSDLSTYRANLSNMQMISNFDLPNTLDAIDDDSWNLACTRLSSVAPSNEADVSFWTDRLRFSKCGAFQILNIDQWILPAGLKTRVVGMSAPDKKRIVCNTHNINMLSVMPPEGVESISIDGDLIACEAGASITLQKVGRHWRRIEPPAVVMSRKHPDAAGPLSDALFTPCLFVFGTLDKAEQMKAWARRTADCIGMKDVKILSDSEVLEQKKLLEDYTLVCFGGSQENKLVAALPVSDVPDNAKVGSAILTYLRPSPYAMDRYMVVNEAMGAESDIGPANLDWTGDWAVYRAGSKTPIALGSFDSRWEQQDIPDHPWRFLAEPR